ncbi:MAG: oxidoreductase [Salibacteraceae bacterium]|nr:oxidoreductase [Salibacteraceae bacterium]
MRNILIALLLFLAACKKPILPTLLPVEKTVENHLRGLSQVNDAVAWASGTKCSVIKTTNGIDWKDVSVKDTASLDFRDIHAFNENEAVVLSAGNGVAIYYTGDGGSNWKLVYSDTNASVFFDGMDFNKQGIGFAFGDPINGKMQVLKSVDFGKSWSEVASENQPELLENEAGFAASGTGIIVSDEAIKIATGGGAKSRILISQIENLDWKYYDTPIASGNGTGIFSMSFIDELNGVIVGGNYVDSTNATSNCAITRDGGPTWTLISNKKPRGYRSCVTSNSKGSLLLTSGRTGVEYSLDKGESWIELSQSGYYSISMHESVGWAVGRYGKMAKIEL